MTQAWKINGRFRGQVQSGVQRVASAYLSRLQTPHTLVEPQQSLTGLKGHLWDQCVLPRKLDGAPLWSPGNVGPIAVRNQVLTVHDAAVFDHPEWFSQQFAAAYHMIVPRVARRCLKVVTVSKFSRDRLIDKLALDPGKVEFIWNGVEETFSPRDEFQIRQAKAAAGVRADRYVATLSTLEPRKNLGLVLRAWDAAKGKLPGDYRLVVIGKAGSAAVFGRIGLSSAERDDVVFTGSVSDVHLPGLLSGADALLYPSLYEGFGLPVVEAMACGTSAITTRCSSLEEVAGDAAIYVDPADPEDLAGQIVRLADSQACRQEFSGRGRERAKLFSWRTSAQRMDEILSDVL